MGAEERLEATARGGPGGIRSDSSVPVGGRGPVELELRDRLGNGEIEGGGLIEVELRLGRASRRGHSGKDNGVG